jgi:S-adenosylmethionine decarboxylase
LLRRIRGRLAGQPLSTPTGGNVHALLPREGVSAVSYPGLEYLVDAYGCDPGTLASIERLNGVVDRLMRDLKLRPVGQPMWHAFTSSNAVTGMILLSDSHVAVHAFPDIQFVAFSLYYGAMRSPWPWSARLHELLGARHVEVRVEIRGRLLPGWNMPSADLKDG